MIERIERLRRAWALSGPEHASFTDQVVAQVRARLASESGDGTSYDIPSAAEEIAANLLSTALSTATVSGPHDYLLTTTILQSIARDIVMRGESLWLFEGNRLAWHDSFDFDANSKPANLLQIVRAMDWNSGRGFSALSSAATIMRLVRQMESGIEWEARQKSRYLTPVPYNQDQVDALKAKIDARSTPDGLVEGEQATGIAGYNPTGNYQQRRMGVDVPANVQTLLLESELLALLTMGVPYGLAAKAPGAEVRDAWRIYVATTVTSVTKSISQAFADLNLQVSLTFPELAASDIALRSRAFRAFRQGGMQIADAAEAAGVPPPKSGAFTEEQPPAPARAPALMNGNTGR